MNIDTKTSNSNSTNVDVNFNFSNGSLYNHSGSGEFKNFLSQNNLALSGDEQSLLYNIISVYEMPYSSNGALDLANHIQSIKSSYNFDCLTIDKADALFFNGMLNGNAYNFSFANGLSSSAAQDKSAAVSKTLMDMLEKSMRTQQPIRLNFDNNISVILRIDRNGGVSAEFLPSSAAAEQYLRNNIAFLRQSLDSQEIKYNDIYYQRQKKNKDKNHKGDDHE